MMSETQSSDILFNDTEKFRVKSSRKIHTLRFVKLKVNVYLTLTNKINII